MCGAALRRFGAFCSPARRRRPRSSARARGLLLGSSRRRVGLRRLLPASAASCSSPASSSGTAGRAAGDETRERGRCCPRHRAARAALGDAGGAGGGARNSAIFVALGLALILLGVLADSRVESGLDRHRTVANSLPRHLRHEFESMMTHHDRAMLRPHPRVGGPARWTPSCPSSSGAPRRAPRALRGVPRLRGRAGAITRELRAAPLEPLAAADRAARAPARLASVRAPGRRRGRTRRARRGPREPSARSRIGSSERRSSPTRYARRIASARRRRDGAAARIRATSELQAVRDRPADRGREPVLTISGS